MSALKASAKNVILPAILIVIILLTAGWTYYSSRAKAPTLPASTIIAESVLEEKYGLRVNLVALTAGGGMVDLRLKIIDSQKASLLLTDKNNFPALYVNDGGITLNASEDDKSQGIKLEDNGSVYLLFPNASNAVKPSAEVSILFGDIAIEAIAVK